MARMHSRKKGKSGSTKPVEKKQPSWLRYKAKEVEVLVQKASKKGLTPSQVGMHLRDVYGIPSVKASTEKSVTSILAEKSMLSPLPEDLSALIKKYVMITKHLEKNKQDQPAKRGLRLTQSKIMRISKYLKNNKKLDASWKFDPKKASLTIE